MRLIEIKNAFWLVSCLIFSLTIFSCRPNAEKGEEKRLSVVCTTGMIGDLVKNIGMDSVDVTSLMGPGVDPHLYKATQGDLAKLQRADVIFYNGLHLEGKMGEVLEQLEKIKTVVPVSRGISKNQLIEDPNYGSAPDPHIWFDVALWSSTIDIVTSTLAESDPANKEYYKRNAEKYRNELDGIHRWVKEKVLTIPENQRILITAHDAFSYFGRTYGIEVRGLQGISTLSEFGLRDRVELVDFIVEKNIKSVFVETSVSEKNIQSIVEGCAAKGHDVEIGGQLFSDAMGAEGSATGNYIGMVRSNVNLIVEGLK